MGVHASFRAVIPAVRGLRSSNRRKRDAEDFEGGRVVGSEGYCTSCEGNIGSECVDFDQRTRLVLTVDLCKVHDGRATGGGW